MRILEYLRTFGEDVLQAGYAIYSLASAAEQGADDADNGISSMSDQIYLKTATGTYLDRWAWDLLKIKRKPLEADIAFRSRVMQSLFLANGTRTAIREIIKLLTGHYPTEILEPVRDTAYFNAGFYLTSGHAGNVNAVSDGEGPYCAKMGSKVQSPYVGYVKVQLPGKMVGGAGLSYYTGREYLDAKAWASDGSNSQRLITIDDLCEAIAMVKPAGTQVFLETF